MIVTMKNLHTRTQDLREAFASIISMMLGLLRAHGLRGLLYLPEVWLASREIKRIGEAFCEMFAAWGAGLASAPAPQQRPAIRGPVRENAGLAQLAEHLICNQGVMCSNHITGTITICKHIPVLFNAGFAL